ncbi:MAG: fumarylacetoacetate hydrolase family protein [Proteobacteria bacterium]|nr:fumarylacetoacetate hydrolase family protein [Pseudomonadota bacterium]
MREVRLGDESFLPTKVVCVGRNFPDHAREMGGESPFSEPVIFIKPNSSIASSPAELFIPEGLGLLHHEVELCALVGRTVFSASGEEAADAVAGWAVGIDFTLRERQAAAKRSGGPWALSKGFDGAAVLGEFRRAGRDFDPGSAELSLRVDGKERQRGNARDMTFSPQEIIGFVSGFMTLERGDVVMCGTPAGVGQVNDGERIRAEAEGLAVLEFTLKRSRGGSCM